MELFQANADYYVNLDTFEFLPVAELDRIGRDSHIWMPWYLWEYAPDARRVSKRKEVEVDGKRWFMHLDFEYSDCIRLNRLVVRVSDNKRVAHIEFYDKVQGRWVKYTCVNRPYIGPISGRGHHKPQTVGVEYTLTVNGESKHYDCHFDNSNWMWPNFRIINSFAIHRSEGMGSIFMYGVSDRQWEICYRGKKLNGSSYIVLCGTWGILLDDDLSFDSLVYLNGAAQDMLDVQEFAYTVNPYVMKARVLLQ